MGSGRRLKSTVQPIAEHRLQAKVCDSSVLCDGGVAAGSLRKRSSREGRLLKLLRPLKKALGELMAGDGNCYDITSEGRGSEAYFSMGVVMGPVDFGGYEAASYYLGRNHNYSSSSLASGDSN